MKKRMGLRIGALLMAMLFVVSLSGCGKPWEKQVKIQNTYSSELYSSSKGVTTSVSIGGELKNLTDKEIAWIFMIYEVTLNNGVKVEATGGGTYLQPLSTGRFVCSYFADKDNNILGQGEVQSYKLKSVEIIADKEEAVERVRENLKKEFESKK